MLKRGTRNHKVEVRFRTTFAFHLSPHGGVALSHSDIEWDYAHACCEAP
jgi:hypothetical protein